MIKVAIKNIYSRLTRNLISLIGLTISIYGAIILITISISLKETVRNTLTDIDGMVIIQKNTVDPLFSSLPEQFKEKIGKIRGVTGVVPEIWEIAPNVEGSNRITNGLKDMLAIYGMDIEAHFNLKKKGIYKRALKKGRFLDLTDIKGNSIVISSRTAKRLNKSIGSSFKIYDRDFKVIGIYNTGSIFLDGALIVSIKTAQRLVKLKKGYVSDFFITYEDGADPSVIEKEIERAIPVLDARSSKEWMTDFSSLMSHIDLFLSVISIIAALIGLIGILNTMVISVRERTKEIGILKSCGWSEWLIYKLFVYEAGILGMGAGLCAGIISYITVLILDYFIELQVNLPFSLFMLGVLTGTLGGILSGLYPARKAAKMDPVDAIRHY